MVDKSDGSLVEGIAPKKITHIEPSLDKEFKAWHKPRKQWIRCNQWQKETDALLSLINLDGRPLRYFSLPGEDMLDIRILAGFCSKKGLRLKCLGYDESRVNQTEVNISWNEVSSIIDLTSIILPDNLSELKNLKSQAFSYVDKLGPFDVINLDLCGSISCISHPDNHQVLMNLCEYQVNKSREPWLLFLTTRADYNQVNYDHLPYYMQCLKSNAEGNSCFHDLLFEISKCNIIDYKDATNIDIILEECKDENFVRLFATGFGKWLLKLLENDKTWIVEMLDSCWYRVEDNQLPESFPNMLSLTFRFSPVHFPLIDPSKLTGSDQEIKDDEMKLAMGILEKTKRFMDLDKKIDSDGPLFEMLLKESSDLLKSARYPIEKYPLWANEKRIRF